MKDVFRDNSVICCYDGSEAINHIIIFIIMMIIIVIIITIIIIISLFKVERIVKHW